MVLKAMKFVHLWVFYVKLKCNGLESNKKLFEKKLSEKTFLSKKKNSMKKPNSDQKIFCQKFSQIQKFSEVPKFGYFLKVM